jgi:hypothetical protein
MSLSKIIDIVYDNASINYYDVIYNLAKEPLRDSRMEAQGRGDYMPRIKKNNNELDSMPRRNIFDSKKHIKEMRDMNVLMAQFMTQSAESGTYAEKLDRYNIERNLKNIQWLDLA